MDEELRRKISIGFMDSLSLRERWECITGGMYVEEAECLYYSEANAVIDWLNKSDKNKVIWYGDEDYPDFRPVERRLPYMLFYNGNFLQSDKKSVAIVGTRHADNPGIQTAFKIGLEASINDISVVSGLADGCDQAALNGAVVGDYPCFGVLGCGLDIKYPSLTEPLKERMLETGGAIISRFAPNTLPFKQNFPNRNLIIAAMGQSTVVVQAPRKSGSLITSDMTTQLGKDVYVSMAGVGDSWFRLGSNLLAEDGCQVIASMKDCYPCLFEAYESKENEGLRFGNKHYFIRSCI